MFSFNFLRLFFPNRMLLGEKISLVRTPIIRIKTRNTTWRSELLQVHEHSICIRSSYISEDRTAMMVNCMPQPPLMSFATHITPHLVHLCFFDGLDDDVHILWRKGP